MSKSKYIVEKEVLKEFLESQDFIDIVQKNEFKFRTKWLNLLSEAPRIEILRQMGWRGWNWAAFFIPLFWLLYRKLYKQAFILIIVGIAMIVLIPSVAGFMQMGFGILCGTLANGYYLVHCLRIREQADVLIGIPDKDNEDENSKIRQRRSAYFAKEGGTTIIALIVCIIGLICLGAFIGVAVELELF